jgi:hypothetical protein
MLRRSLLLAAVLVATIAPAARADRMSRGDEQLHQQLGAACRFLTDASNDCDALDGYHLNEADVERYEASWVHRALGLQRTLDDGAALKDELLPHTHNSFNSEAYTPTLSRNDHNQLLSLTDQLRLDIRAVEIDVHRSVSVQDGSIGVVACHANENEVGPAHVHIGCTTEDPLRPYLAELRTWLDANPTEFVLLYLENHLEGDPASHDLAVADIEATIGDLVATTASHCEPMPYDTSRAALRPARVLIVGNCGPGAWGTYVHDRGSRWDESSNPAGDDYSCTAERGANDYDGDVTRRYEDRTWLSAMVGSEGGITKAEMAEMVRCGVNLVGFDMLHPDDPRLETLVWSWAPGEPSTSGCATQRDDGRLVASSCGDKRRAACYDGTAWSVTRKEVRFARAADACAAVGAGFDVPWNGWENERLLEAGGGDVWVAYADSGSGWQVQRSS